MLVLAAIGGLALLIVAVAVLTDRGSRASAETIHPFTLPSVLPSGPQAVLPAVPGRPTVVTFFAAWCDPCRAELPLVEAAARRSGAPAVVGVDVLDQRPDAQQLMQQAGVTFPSGYDHDGTVSERWGIVGLPVTVFIAPDGRVVSFHRGELKQHQLDDLLHRLARAA
jgi:thiol-disulfide isomerase/thioredoxin